MAAAARVIIIEDHVLVADMLAALVRDSLQLTVVAQARNVAEAITACRTHRPELVLLDYMLPDGRGLDVVKAVGPELETTRWLLLTSNERGHVIDDALTLGVQGCMMKRSEAATLRIAVSEVLAGRTYFCPESTRLLIEARNRFATSVGSNLSPREREVLQRFARGENPKVMADHLGLSVKTVQNSLSTVKEKLRIQEPAELVRVAIQLGLVEAP